jgi:dCTP deaminase
MFLGSTAIRDSKDRMFLDNTFDPDRVNQCSYDLRLGAEAYVVGKHTPIALRKGDPYLVLPPGQFAILTCFEKLSLPRDIMAFITLRNRYKMQGLVNVSGFHVDPTFEDQLVFAVQNVGPTDIRLKFMEPTFSIFFARVENNTSPKKPKEDPRHGITLQDINQLGGSTITLIELRKFAHLYQRPVSYFTGEVVASQLPEDVEHLARTATKLSDRDRQELARFAEFLSSRSKNAD